jgi:hypothetical protein
MKLVLTNTGSTAIPVIEPTPGNVIRGRAGREEREGWIEILQPNQPLTVDEGTSVLVIGDKPSVREQFERAYVVLTESAQALLQAYHNRTRPDMPTDDTQTVNVTIQNNGQNAVRVILGDGVTDVTVAAGAVQDASAKGYLELRELGLIQQPHNSGTPD